MDHRVAYKRTTLFERLFVFIYVAHSQSLFVHPDSYLVCITKWIYRG